MVAPGGASNILALGGASSGSFDVSKVVDTATAGMTDEYAGFTGFEKTGSSIWTLTGTSSSAMPLTVNDGTLLVNGSTASSSLTTVNAGETLGGGGTVGNTLVNGGTLSPGNSIGTLTVAGDLVFTSASTYMVEVSPANR